MRMGFTHTIDGDGDHFQWSSVPGDYSYIQAHKPGVAVETAIEVEFVYDRHNQKIAAISARVLVENGRPVDREAVPVGEWIAPAPTEAIHGIAFIPITTAKVGERPQYRR